MCAFKTFWSTLARSVVILVGLSLILAVGACILSIPFNPPPLGSQKNPKKEGEPFDDIGILNFSKQFKGTEAQFEYFFLKDEHSMQF